MGTRSDENGAGTWEINKRCNSHLLVPREPSASIRETGEGSFASLEEDLQLRCLAVSWKPC